MSIALLFLAIGATFRLSYLIIYERGPWSLAERLRSWVVNRYGAKSWQGEGIQCILCVSFWISFLAAIPYTAYAVLAIVQLGVWFLPALVPLAIAAVFGMVWWGIAGGCLVLHSWLIRR